MYTARGAIRAVAVPSKSFRLQYSYQAVKLVINTNLIVTVALQQSTPSPFAIRRRHRRRGLGLTAHPIWVGTVHQAHRKPHRRSVGSVIESPPSFHSHCYAVIPLRPESRQWRLKAFLAARTFPRDNAFVVIMASLRAVPCRLEGNKRVALLLAVLYEVLSRL